MSSLTLRGAEVLERQKEEDNEERESLRHSVTLSTGNCGVHVGERNFNSNTIQYTSFYFTF